MKIPGRKRDYQNICFFLTLILALSIVSCVSSKTHWLYLRADSTAKKGSTTNLTVGILPFEDNRPASERVGLRVLPDGREEPIRLASESPSQDITSILRTLLEARGIRTVMLIGWEPAAANLKDLPDEVDIAIAGSVEAIEVGAVSFGLKSDIRYVVKLTGKYGYKAQGKLVTQKVERRPEGSVMSFQRRNVEAELNETLSTVLEGMIDTALSSAE